jgi:putative phosphoribosyl transferase
MGVMQKFLDRQDAGKKLAIELSKYSFENPLIIALLRGGIHVATEISKMLAIPFDIWIVRKIGAPWEREFAIGAIAEGGYTYLAVDTIEGIGVSESELNALIEKETIELKERVFMYRGVRSRPVVEGRTIILVDDGIATGATVRAAAGAIRNGNPLKIILAVPVASPDSLTLLRNVFDQEVCLLKPDNLFAVGTWYEDFSQVSDDEVLSILNSPSDV